MSAIALVNACNARAEFLVHDGVNPAARVGVPEGGTAFVPTTVDGGDSDAATYQRAIYAVVNDLATVTMVVDDPNATVTVLGDDGSGYSLIRT